MSLLPPISSHLLKELDHPPTPMVIVVGDDDDVAREVYHIVALVSLSQPAVLRKINSKSFFSPQSKPPTAALLQCLQLPPKEAKGGQNSKVGPKVAKEATHSLPRDRQKAKGLQDCRRLN